MSMRESNRESNIVLTFTLPCAYATAWSSTHKPENAKKLKLIKRTQKAKNLMNNNHLDLWPTALRWVPACLRFGLWPHKRLGHTSDIEGAVIPQNERPKPNTHCVSLVQPLRLPHINGRIFRSYWRQRKNRPQLWLCIFQCP